MRLALAAIALMACHPPKAPTMSTSTTWPALDATLLADAAATFNFRLGIPSPVAITKDGAVLFRRTPPRSFASDLYELAPDGAVKTLATVADLMGSAEEHLSDAEKARRERSRTATRGIVDVDVSDDGSLVMIPLGGMLHLVERPSGKRTTVDPKGEAYDPHLSPDGKLIAFVRDGDLWTIGTSAGATAKQLTKHPAELEYGVAEHAAMEELNRGRGFWWSPDSKQLVFQRTDARGVDTMYVSNPREPAQKPVPFKYPRAGRPNAIVDLGVIAATGGEPKWWTWDLARFPYLASVHWQDGPLAALVMNRDQTDVAVIAFDPASGKQTTLLTEHDDAWINVAVGAPRWLPDGSGRFLWMTEKHGDWTLELHGTDGKVTDVTRPEFGLRHLLAVEPGAAIVQAQTDPTLQDIYRVPLDGSTPTRITNGDGVSGARAKHGVIVVDTLLAKGGRQIFVQNQSGRHELPSAAEQPKLVPTTVFETVELGGRTHHVSITRPRAFVKGKKYPVLLKVYGGPHAVMVQRYLDGYVMDQWYADAGFIIVRSDNRGTPNRGRAWERAILKDLVSVPMDDQVGALQALGKRYTELDLSRVGIVGWSFGGYMAAMGVLMRPDVFKAAVAGAPVTDWALYDTAYTERYMKTPEANPEGYKRGNAMTYAAKLERPLLLVHGITDDNVHFAHTLALIEALYVEGKYAEVITLSATHMLPDPKLNLAKEQVQIDFFRKHLGPPP